MSANFFSHIGDVVKTAVAAWSVTWIEPWLEKIAPEMHDAAKFFLAALVAATMVVILTRLAGWPTIKIEWLEDSTPASEITAKLRARNPSQSQPFILRVVPGGKGWLGHFCLRGLVRPGCFLRIGVENASVTSTCELYTKRAGVPTVTPNDSINGVNVDLGDPPQRPEGWHVTTVRWKDDGTPRGENYNIKYKLEHENKVRQLFLNLLIRKSVKAKKFRVQG